MNTHQQQTPPNHTRSTLLMRLMKNLHRSAIQKTGRAEWKWDGIRGQIIKRNNELFVWSRGEELITEKFPEYFPLKNCCPTA